MANEEEWPDEAAMEELVERLKRRPEHFLMVVRGTLLMRPEPEVRAALDALDRIESKLNGPYEVRDLREAHQTGFAQGLKLARDVQAGADALVQELASLFGWEDRSYAHALLHVGNAVLNLKADLAVAQDEEVILAEASRIVGARQRAALQAKVKSVNAIDDSLRRTHDGSGRDA